MLGETFGTFFKDKDDIIKDISILNEICQDYKETKNKLDALILGFGIETMTKCSCRDYTNKISFEERIHCDKCKGLGYIITYKNRRNND